MSNPITPQLIRHDLPGLAAVVPYQSLEESLRRCSVTAGLQEYINDFPILIHSPPQVMLLAVDLHEHFINVEGIAISLMTALQTPGIFSPELDAP
jgi:hypothetical protein